MPKQIEWKFRAQTIVVVDRDGVKREEIEAAYQLVLTSLMQRGVDSPTVEESLSSLTLTIAPGETEADYAAVLFAPADAEQTPGRAIAHGNSPDEAMRRGLDRIRQLLMPAIGLIDTAEAEFDKAERPPWRLYRCSSEEGAERFVVARTPICARCFYVQREKIPPGIHVDCRDIKELLPTAKRIIPSEKHPVFLLGYASREMLDLCGIPASRPGKPLPK